MTNALTLFIATFFLGAQAAVAFDIEVDLSCPIVAQAGSSLFVDVLLENEECRFDVTFERIFVAIAGNTNDSVGGVGIFGPFARAHTHSGLIPKATCTAGFFCDPFFGCPISTPGRTVVPSVMITDALPPSLAPTVAAMIVSIEASASVPVPFPPDPNTPPTLEEGFPSGNCLVEITPAP